MTHNTRSGGAHMAAESEEACLFLIREMLSYLPSNNMEDPPFRATTDDNLRTEPELNKIIPENPNKPYDIKEVVKLIVDDGEFYETQEHFAQNIVVGFARLGGQSVGIVANQPMVLAGVLDINASEKAWEFFNKFDIKIYKN